MINNQETVEMLKPVSFMFNIYVKDKIYLSYADKDRRIAPFEKRPASMLERMSVCNVNDGRTFPYKTKIDYERVASR